MLYWCRLLLLFFINQIEMHFHYKLKVPKLISPPPHYTHAYLSYSCSISIVICFFYFSITQNPFFHFFQFYWFWCLENILSAYAIFICWLFSNWILLVYVYSSMWDHIYPFTRFNSKRLYVLKTNSFTRICVDLELKICFCER